jgi:DNA-directed RNA polymerase specialized sigma24 family protein
MDWPARPAPPPLLKQKLGDCLEWLAAKHPRYGRIFQLHWLGHSTSEVCQDVGLSREQYYVYLGRSRKMLQQCLHEKGVEL